MAAQPVPTPGASAPVAIKTVLFATDFSPCSDQALPYAAALAGRYGARLLLAHIIEPEPRSSVPLEPYPAEYDRVRRHARENLEKLKQHSELQAVRHEALLEQGPLWTALADLIQKRRVDLLVAGTHGREGIRKLLLGSVAEQIFRHAPCPVLLVGPRVSWPPSGSHFERILYATDFSPDALCALPYALSLAQEYEAQLTLLHVVHADANVPVEFVAGAYSDEMLAEADRRLRALLPAGVALPAPPQFRVEYGFAPESILGLALELKAGVIVMGAHRDGVAATHLPWTTAHRVVCHAPCPVLTVNAK
jgi:nucleotide-binding universal stress UspA family protein